MKPNNSETIKTHNRRNVLNIIRSAPVSRASLAEKTGLTKAAITFIVNALIEEGMIYEKEQAKSSIGRHPTLLDINADYGYVAGVLIERGMCCVCITDYKCNMIDSADINLYGCKNAVSAIDKISIAIEKLLRQAQIPKEKLLVAGIACPGPVNYKTGVILNPPDFYMWQNAPAAQMLSGVIGVPAFIENLSVALAFAEYRYGCSASGKSSMFVETTTGIGTALIVGGKVFRGSAGYGVELGHSSVNIEGEKCSCGNNGCLETYASLKSLITIFSDIWPGSWSKVIDGYLAGDENCTKIFEHEIKYLSSAFVSAVNLYDLDLIILCKRFAYKSEVVTKRLQDEVSHRSMISKIHPIQIKIAEFDAEPTPALRAAAAMAIEHTF